MSAHENSPLGSPGQTKAGELDSKIVWNKKDYAFTLEGSAFDFYQRIDEYMTKRSYPTYRLITLHWGCYYNERKHKFKIVKPHYHCFYQYRNSKQVSSEYLFGAHVEEVRTPQGYKDYCKGKDEKHIKRHHACEIIIEEGEIREHGGNRYQTVGAIQNMTDEEIPELDWKQYNTAMKIRADMKLKQQQNNKFIAPVNVQWHFGDTGSGKTFGAWPDYLNVPYDEKGGKYYDWGDARKIKFEEQRDKNFIPWSELLQITDKYHNDKPVRVLYGWKLVDIDAVWIASPNPPWVTYPNKYKNDDIRQLMRRMKWVVYEHRRVGDDFEVRVWRYNLEDSEPCVTEDWKVVGHALSDD